ncbi:hypothetical protein VitviT2T_022235 [Vitis vinifera]|uniref:CBS domain-containing protein n=1 Tax=Vitis vinifera TaxID=29760 RepID=A0ABY9D988_VITVI|nr:hypothetical protein VitviT2T_022235 [Vitis vinifera]
MRNLTVGEHADAKPQVVTLGEVEKVARLVDVLRNTTHNGFPVVDEGLEPPVGLVIGATELHGIVLRAHLVKLLKKKWFLPERRRREWEVSPVVGILTRQDLRTYNKLTAFPHLAKSKERDKGN